MRKISPEEAAATYDILVRHAGARDDEMARHSFVYHVASCEHPTMEYRFGGHLGWGGKFRNNGNHDNTPYVDCYSEHLNPERKAVILATNAMLAELFGAV
jgi:hypothetical protein